MKRIINAKFTLEGDDLDDDLVTEILTDMVEHINLLNEDDDLVVDTRGWDDVKVEDGPKALDELQELLTQKALIAGAVVRFTEPVERYPSALVKTNENGIVTKATRDEVYVRLYSAYPGLKEWGNEVHFYLTDPNHLAEVQTLEVIA